jgi:hypothetical protein
MLPIFCTAYSLILLTAFVCAVILINPLRALYSEIMPQPGQRDGRTDALWRKHVTLVVAGLLLSASLNACAHLSMPLQ